MSKKNKDYTAGLLAGFEAFLPPTPTEERTVTREGARREVASANEIIKEITKVPAREKCTRRLNLIMPPSVVEAMRSTCKDYALSLNAGAILAFKLFIEEMEKQGGECR